MKNQQNMINGKQIIRKPMTADEFNDLIFEIIGLDTTDDGIVIDADYNTIIAIKQKYMTIYPENESFDTIVYDPARNPSIMDKLFKYYLVKIERETGNATKAIVYGAAPKGAKSYIEVDFDNGETYKSGNYFNDNIKCADIIIKINDDSNTYDLTKLDEELIEFMAKQALLKQKMRKKRR